MKAIFTDKTSTILKSKIDYPLYYPKIYLIQLFNFVAILFILPLSIKSFLAQNYYIALPLFAVGIATIINYYILEKSKNENFASHFLSSIFFILMTYLIYTGGINHTGPLWIPALPLIVFFLLGLKKGFSYIILFLIFAFIIFFIPFDLPLKVEYPHDFTLRVILSFLLVTFLSAMYEYNNISSFYSMQTLREELEYNSTRDYLTSLYNRRGYEKHIQSIENPKGVILMCDMDNFKKVNDTYGHDAGDFVLKNVAQKIKSTLRKDDLAVRWGGEEFFVFLPFTSINDGKMIAEKIRTTIESLSLLYNDQHIKITLSIGVEVITDTLLLQNAIAHADKAMYQAKKEGRNAIAIYSDL